MATFKILTGKALSAAIAGFGKVSATYSEKTHQLAYSALNHVEEHHDACHLNSLYAATPVNYRSALVRWSTAFGKVTFDAKELAFTYAKGKASDMPAALAVSPADYVKDSSTKAEAKFDEIAQLESVIKRFTEKGASRKMLSALKGALRMVKGEVPAAENVVPAAKVIKARKAKASKAAPKAAAETVAETVAA